MYIMFINILLICLFVLGKVCPVIGRVCMDCITIKVPEDANECREFCLMSPDFNDVNSGLAMARVQKTIPYEVCTNVSIRVPRLYSVDDKVLTEV